MNTHLRRNRAIIQIAGIALSVVLGVSLRSTPVGHAIIVQLESQISTITPAVPSPSPVAHRAGDGVIAAPNLNGVASPFIPELDTTTPVYPIVQGAPCGPPGEVVNGACVVPIGAKMPTPTYNPAADQPGQGAECKPPGVLLGTACVVPQPTPSPVVVPSPSPEPTAQPTAAPTSVPSPAPVVEPTPTPEPTP